VAAINDHKLDWLEKSALTQRRLKAISCDQQNLKNRRPESIPPGNPVFISPDTLADAPTTSPTINAPCTKGLNPDCTIRSRQRFQTSHRLMANVKFTSLGMRLTISIFLGLLLQSLGPHAALSTCLNFISRPATQDSASQVSNAGSSDDVELATDAAKPLTLRKLYVPADALTQFMKDRPTFLPLSTNRFNAIIDSLQRKAPITTSIVPIKHWLTLSNQGRVQGFSVFEVRDAEKQLDSRKTGWVSLDLWQLPGTFYKLSPSLLTDGDFLSLGRLQVSSERIYPSVTQTGQLGIDREKIDRYILIQFDLQLLTPTQANSYEGTARDSINLPANVETLSFVRVPAEFSVAQSQHLTQFSIADLPGLEVPSQPQSWHQLCSDNGTIPIALAFSKKGSVSPSSESLAETENSQPGTYVERLNVSIAGNLINYKSEFDLTFPTNRPSQLICTAPFALDISACLVDGKSVPFSIIRSHSTPQQVAIKSLELKTKSTISIVSKQTISDSNRVNLHRPSIQGHHWIGGNVQVSIETPWTVSDYELVNCQVESAQAFGVNRNLKIQFGTPTSSATLILSGQDKPVVDSSYARLNFERDALQVQQWLSLDLEYQDSNTLEFPIGDDWIVDQIGQAKDLPTLPALSSEIGNTEISQLAWYVTNNENQRMLVVTIPEFAIGRTLLLRAQAHRSIQTGKLDFSNGLIFTWPKTQTPKLLLALRSQSPIVVSPVNDTQLLKVTDAEAKIQFPIFNKSIDSEAHLIARPGQSLSVVVEDEERTGYSAEAYIANQLLSNGLLSQTHRLLVQPEGSTVNAVNLLSLSSDLGSSQWAVFDSEGQLLPFEKVLSSGDPIGSKPGEGNSADFAWKRWTLKLKQPTSSSFSILIRRTLPIQKSGTLPFFRLPDASTFRGWIDNHSSCLATFWVTDLDSKTFLDTNAGNAKFIQQSRSWAKLMQQLGDDRFAEFQFALSNNGPGNQSSERLTTGTFCDYQAKTERLVYKVVEEADEISQQFVTDVQVFHHFGIKEVGTRCLITLFSKLDSEFEILMPQQSSAKSLRVDGLILPFLVDKQKLKFRLSRNGQQTIELFYVSNIQHLGVISQSNDLAIAFHSPPLRISTYLDLPLGFLPKSTTPGTLDWTQLSQSLLSPLICRPSAGQRIGNWRLQNGSIGSLDIAQSNRWKWDANHPVTKLLVVNSQAINVWHWFSFLTSFALIVLTQFLLLARRHHVTQHNHTPSETIHRFTLNRSLSIILLGLMLAVASLFYWSLTEIISSIALGIILGGMACRFFLTTDSITNAYESNASNILSRLKYWSKPGQGKTGLLAMALASQLAVGQSNLVAAFQEETRPTPTVNELDAGVQPVVIPVDKDQKPNSSVVYLNQQVYDMLTAVTQQKSLENDLQLLRSRYLLEFDPQLQRLRSLVCNVECRINATKVYQFPFSINAASQLRQIRVNGVPTIFQRQDQIVNLQLEASANTKISLSYDLQSLGTSLQYTCFPTLENSLAIEGIPSSWFASVRNMNDPSYQISPEPNGDFRIDRAKQVQVNLYPKDQPPALPTLETWLAIDPASIECETRLFLGDSGTNVNSIQLEVDPRLSLSNRQTVSPLTWSVTPITSEGFAKRFNISIDDSHPAGKAIILQWDFNSASFGEMAPPFIHIIEPKFRYKRWLVASVDEKIVYQLRTLPAAKFRRGSSVDLRSSQRKFLDQGTSTNPLLLSDPLVSNAGTSESRRVLSPDYVYELIGLENADFQYQAIADITPQPLQSSVVLDQSVLVDPDKIQLQINGTIDVGIGQISQIRFSVPADFSLQQLVALQKGQNKVAWTQKGPNIADAELICFLKSPLTGKVDFELSGTCQSPIIESRELPSVYPKYFTATNNTIRVYTSPDMILNAINSELASQGTDVTNSQVIPGYSLGTVLQFEPRPDQPMPTFNLTTAPKQNRFLGSALYRLEDSDSKSFLNLRLDLSDSQKTFDRFQLEKTDSLGLPEVKVISTQDSGPAINLTANLFNDGVVNFDLDQATNRCIIDLRFPILGKAQTLSMPKLKLISESFETVLADSASLRERYSLPATSLIQDDLQAWSNIDWLPEGTDLWQATAPPTEPFTLVSKLPSVDASKPSILLNQVRIRSIDNRKEVTHILGLQQLLLETNGNQVVDLIYSQKIAVQQVWCDESLASVESVSAGVNKIVKIAIDPANRFCLISLRIEIISPKEETDLQLPHLEGANATECFLGLPPAMIGQITGNQDAVKSHLQVANAYKLQKNDALKKWILAGSMGDTNLSVDPPDQAGLFQTLEELPLQRINHFSRWFRDRQAAEGLTASAMKSDDVYEFLQQAQDNTLSTVINPLGPSHWVRNQTSNLTEILAANHSPSETTSRGFFVYFVYLIVTLGLVLSLKVLATSRTLLDGAYLICVPMLLVSGYFCDAPISILLLLLTLMIGAIYKRFGQIFSNRLPLA